jgi:hypothetical protein
MLLRSLKNEAWVKIMKKKILYWRKGRSELGEKNQ